MNANNLHIVWTGSFRCGLGDYKTFKLEFNAPDLDTAQQTIRDYVEGKNGQGWQLQSNDIHVTYNH